MKNRILTILFLLISSSLFAQKGTVSGVLSDDEGLPLPGVSIVVKEHLKAPKQILKETIVYNVM